MRSLVATIGMIQSYKDTRTNYVLALSEFIDNSIGSYTQNNENNPIFGLNIDIDVNFVNSNKMILTITDNANGMNGFELEKAMQPCDRENKKDTNFNQYGIGMKLGVFWFGENLTVYSKQKNNIEYKLELNTRDVNPNNEVVVEALPSKENILKDRSSGTKIIISYIYENRNFIDQKNQINLIKAGLGARYSRMIENGLKIKFKIHDENDNEEFYIEEYKIIPFKRDQLFEKQKKRNTNQTVLKQRQEQYDKEINEIYNNINNELQNFDNLTDEKKEDLNLFIEAYNKFNNNEDLVFERQIIVNNKPCKIKFGIHLMKNAARYSGLTIYHLNRAIIHGPNDQNIGFGNMQFYELRPGVGGDERHQRYRYFYGELDLTGIEKPDTNKSNFSWSLTGQEDIKHELDRIFNSLADLVVAITRVDDIDENKHPTKEQADNISKSIHNRIPTFQASSSYQNNNGEMVINGKIKLPNGELCIVEIVETNNSRVEFFDIDFDQTDNNENKLIIYIESENKFWKPFISKSEFKNDILYPIALLLGCYNIADSDKWRSKIDPNKSMKFSQILSMIVNEWWVDNND